MIPFKLRKAPSSEGMGFMGPDGRPLVGLLGLPPRGVGEGHRKL